MSTPLTPEQLVRAKQIAGFLTAIFNEGDHIEVRSLKSQYGTIRHLSTDLRALAKTAILAEISGGDVYYALNPVSPASMYARHHTTDRPMRQVTATAGNMDIAVRANYLIDLDPVRPTGQAATAEQREAAARKADVVEGYLTGEGWPTPNRIDSGNGIHLIYKADRCTPHNRVWPDALAGLSRQFSDDEVAIDTSVSNAARISRMPFTLNRKAGRISYLLSTPHVLQIVAEDQIRALAMDSGEEDGAVHVARPRAISTRNLSVAIDRDGIEQLIDEYPTILELRATEDRGDVTYFHLATCPFAGRAHRGIPGRSAIIHRR